MKSILIKITPYLVLYIILNLICFKTSGFYEQESEYLERIDHTIDKQSKIIFLGDSHVESIKLLNLSSEVGNLAYGADGIDEMYIKVLTMIKFNKNLETVFIATEPQIFNDVSSPNSTFLNKYLLKIDDTLNVYNKSKLNLITEKLPLLNDSYISYVMNAIYSSFKSTNTSENEIKWSERSNEERAKIATETGKSDHNAIMNNESSKIIYKEIIEICKLNNIKVIGIRFPVNENYINQSSNEDTKKVNDFIKTLNLNYHLDYSKEFTNPKYFKDQDHLNITGLNEFVKIIFEQTDIKITK